MGEDHEEKEKLARKKKSRFLKKAVGVGGGGGWLKIQRESG